MVWKYFYSLSQHLEAQATKHIDVLLIDYMVMLYGRGHPSGSYAPDHPKQQTVDIHTRGLASSHRIREDEAIEQAPSDVWQRDVPEDLPVIGSSDMSMASRIGISSRTTNGRVTKRVASAIPASHRNSILEFSLGGISAKGYKMKALACLL